jgi:uncharacterized membrane protein
VRQFLSRAGGWLLGAAYVAAFLAVCWWGVTVPSPLPCPTCASDAATTTASAGVSGSGVLRYHGTASPAASGP